MKFPRTTAWGLICMQHMLFQPLMPPRTKVLLLKAVAAAHPRPAAMCAVVTEFPSPSQLEGKLGFWQEAELNPICNNQPGSR